MIDLKRPKTPVKITNTKLLSYIQYIHAKWAKNKWEKANIGTCLHKRA